MDHQLHDAMKVSDRCRDDANIPEDALVEATAYLMEAHGLYAVFTGAERMPVWVQRDCLVLTGHLTGQPEELVTVDIDLAEGKPIDSGIPSAGPGALPAESGRPSAGPGALPTESGIPSAGPRTLQIDPESPAD